MQSLEYLTEEYIMPHSLPESLPITTSRLLSRPSFRQEVLATDDRAALRPSEVVQLKLLGLLPAHPIPVSSLHTHRDCRR
jgi:hypothetical protein